MVHFVIPSSPFKIPYTGTIMNIGYSKTCLKQAATQKEDQKLFFKTDYHLMQVKSTAECSKNASREHSAILSTFIKLPFVFKTFVFSVFEFSLRQVLLYIVWCIL